MDVVAPRGTGHQGKTLVSAELTGRIYHLLVFGRLSASKSLSFFNWILIRTLTDLTNNINIEAR